MCLADCSSVKKMVCERGCVKDGVWQSRVWQKVGDKVVCERWAESRCVCVCTIWIDVKLLLIAGGSPGSRGGRWPTKTPPRDPCKRTCGTVVVHLGAFKSQLVATTVPYIYIIFMSPVIGFTGVFLHVRCIPHHQFAKMFLSKCVIPVVYVKLAGTLRGKPFQANNWQ